YLDGGAGADLIDGGEGTDTVQFGYFSAAVNVSLATGLGAGGDAEGDRYVSVENLTGTRFNDVLEGNDVANVIFGGEGDDVIRGLGGNDTLGGWKGNDTFYGGAGADLIDGGDGFDYARYDDSPAGVTITLRGLDRAIADGGDATGDQLANIEGLVGSAFADTLTGDGFVNDLQGG